MENLQTYEKQAKAAFEEFHHYWESKRERVFVPQYSSPERIILLLILIIVIWIMWWNQMDTESVLAKSIIFLFLLIPIGLAFLFPDGVSESEKERALFYREMANFLGMEFWEDGQISSGLVQAGRVGFDIHQNVSYSFWTRRCGVGVNIQRVDWTVKNEDTTWYYYAFAFSYHLNTPVKGLTILTSDSLQSKITGHSGGLKRIKLEWLDFEEAFDLFSTDEKGVREFMTPDVMALLYDFYHLVQNWSMKIVFYADQISFFCKLGQPKSLRQKKNQWLEFRRLYLLQYVPALLKMKLVTSVKPEEIPQLSCAFQDFFMNMPDSKGLTPIMYSILDGNMEKWERYIAYPETDVNQRFEKNGSTLLHLAVSNNRVEMVKKLLQMPNLEVDATNNKGKTALDVARELKYPVLIALLEKHSQK